MKLRFRFNGYYLLLTIILFLVEVFIAMYVHDNIVRPYIGDVLVVILLYCFVKSFLPARVLTTAIAVLLFAYFIEACQYFRVIYMLGLGRYPLARVVFGIGFDWTDILAYTVGAIIVLLVEYARAAQPADREG